MYKVTQRTLEQVEKVLNRKAITNKSDRRAETTIHDNHKAKKRQAPNSHVSPLWWKLGNLVSVTAPSFHSFDATALPSATFSNKTSTAIATSAPTCTNAYGGTCGLIFGAEGWNWWPITYSQIVATKYVTVDEANSTSTRIEYNNASFTIPEADYSSYRMYGTAGADQLTETAVTTFGTTLYWPTNYIALAAQYTITSDYAVTGTDGKVSCTSTWYQTTAPQASADPSYQIVIPVSDSVATAGAGTDTEAQIPFDSPIIAGLGLDPAWNCSGGGGGIPVANVPVLSLTATSSIFKGGVTTQVKPPTTPSAPPLPDTAKPTPSPTSPGSPVVNSPMPSSPPANNPPASNPPASNPPASNPPANNPPSNNPPANDSPGSSNSPPSGSSNNPSGGSSNSAASGGSSNNAPNGNSNNPQPNPPVIPVQTIGGFTFSVAPTSNPASPDSGSGLGSSLGSGSSSGSGDLIIVGNGGNGNGPAPTLTPGGAAVTVGGTPISLAPAATGGSGSGSNPNAAPPALIIGGSTVPLTNPFVTPAPSAAAGAGAGPVAPTPLTIAGQTLTPAPSGSGAYVLASGSTLSPGGPAVTISGTPYSLAAGSSGSPGALIVGTGPFASTVPLPTITPAPGAPITLPNGQVLTPATSSGAGAGADAGAYVLASGQTLTPGGAPVTLSGTRYSLFPSGTAFAIGSSTIPLSPTSSSPPPLIVAGQTITPNAASAYVFTEQDGKLDTLTRGGVVTVTGRDGRAEVVSLAGDGGTVVVDGKTEVLASATASGGGGTGGIGGLVWSGVGGSGSGGAAQTGSGAGSGNATQFTGGAAQSFRAGFVFREDRITTAVSVLLGVAVFLFYWA
ncbi:MAG: hypothetical protein Q9160_007827 [Pyrenula sp. 1 TL-2023]